MEISIPDNVAYFCIGIVFTITAGAVSYFIWQRKSNNQPKKSIEEKEDQEQKEEQKQDQKETNDVETLSRHEEPFVVEEGQDQTSMKQIKREEPPPYSEECPENHEKFFNETYAKVPLADLHHEENRNKVEHESAVEKEEEEAKQAIKEDLKEEIIPEQENESKPVETVAKEIALEVLIVDVVKEQIKIPQITFDSPTETAHFAVDERGCTVLSPYCKLHFPPGTTKNMVHIDMTPDYEYSHAIFDDQISISPIVNFTSDQKLEFDRKITVEIHTNYTAVEGNVPVEVIWREDCGTKFKKLTTTHHGNDRFVRFQTKHFCGYSVVADESQLQNMQRHYYSTMYRVMFDGNDEQILYWMIYEDCPHVTSKNIAYLNGKRMVKPPEVFSLRYGYNLQLCLINNCPRINIGNNHQPISLSQKWGSRVNESFQFQATKQERDCSSTELQFQLLALHSRNQATFNVREKKIYLPWREEQGKSLSVNVSGPQAVGIMQNTYADTPCRQTYQHQQSTVSNASSGYSSELPTPSTIGRSFSDQSTGAQAEERCCDEQLLSETHEEPAVGDFSPYSSTPPLAHSTPRSTVAEDETLPKSEEEIPPNGKSFA